MRPARWHKVVHGSSEVDGCRYEEARAGGGGDARRRAEGTLRLEPIRAFTGVLFDEDLHAKRVESLANGVAGVLSAAIVADEGWRPAVTLAEAFERLRENGVVTKPTADAMAKAAGLRNVVAHGYAGVDIEMVFAAASRGVSDLDAFAAEVAAWLQARMASA